jgi:hypothetical protein
MAVYKVAGKLKDQIAGVMKDLYAKRVNFHLGHLHVNGAEFPSIAKLIEGDKIKCYADVPTVPAGQAQYRSDHDSLLFGTGVTIPRLQDIWFRALILHEGVHAYVDLKTGKSKATTFLTDECAGYIAQVIYLRYRGGNTSHWSPTMHAVLYYTQELVRKFNMESGRTRIRWVHYEDLRRRIQSDPMYITKGKKIPWKMKTHADGIKGA